MDKEQIINQFNDIEARIEKLLVVCKRLDVENIELRNQNNLLNSLLEEKNEAEKQNDEIKRVIRSKIDSLMGKLDEFTEG